MTEAEARELEPPLEVLRRGATGPDVKRVQEWLTLHGYGVALDGEFGPVTEAAVRLFLAKNPARIDQGTPGEVNEGAWTELTSPMRMVVRSARTAIGALRHGSPFELSRYVALVAAYHHAVRPREVGGENRGPWVRLFMDGKEGAEYPWCAGWATYVLGQVLAHVRLANPWRTFSCDDLARRAQARHQLLRAPKRGERAQVKPGCLFLVSKTDGDWVHTGIVTRVAEDAFHTLEGNTNRVGAREGTELRARVRPFNSYTDFLLLEETAAGRAVQ